MIIGYLGPEGTFSEDGVNIYKKIIQHEYGNCDIKQFRTIYSVILAAEKSEIDIAFVPIENSTEGSVRSTIDTLIFESDLKIIAEVVLDINQNFMVKKENTSKKITKIISHRQGICQCDKYIRNNFKDVEIEEVSSTARAAEIVSLSNECIAAIGNKSSAFKYNLNILDNNIQDEKNNKTRFVALSKNENKMYSEKKKTSIVFCTDDKPGELYKMIDILSIWDINMTKIESRPMKTELGKYVFLVDLEAKNELDLFDALKMIERKSSFYKYLGTYPVFSRN